MELPCRITGSPKAGTQYASSLGFPTLNLPLTKPLTSGIYAGIAQLCNTTCPAALFVNDAETTLEVHLVDCPVTTVSETKEVTVDVEEKIRESITTTSREELIRVISRDVERVRRRHTKTQ
jgi:FAD synthase